MVTVIFHDHVVGSPQEMGVFKPQTADRTAARLLGVQSLRGLLRIGTRVYAPGASDTTGCSVDLRPGGNRG